MTRYAKNLGGHGHLYPHGYAYVDECSGVWFSLEIEKEIFKSTLLRF